MVKTIVTVLSSAINCKVLRIGRYEVLQIGSLISSYDCADIIEACADVLVKLEGHGGFEEVIGDCLFFIITSLYELPNVFE